MRLLPVALTSALVLAACDTTTRTPDQTEPTAPAELPTLDVRFSKGIAPYRWSDSDGVGRKVSLYGMKVENDQYSDVLLAEGTTGPDHKAVLSKVPREKIEPLLSEMPKVPAECTGNIQVSAAGLRLSETTTLRVDTTGLTILGDTGALLLNPDGSTPSGHTAYNGGYPNTFMYADRAATVRGTVVCPGGTYSLNLTLKAGWNFVQQNYQEAADGRSSFSTTSLTAGAAVTVAPSGAY